MALAEDARGSSEDRDIAYPLFKSLRGDDKNGPSFRLYVGHNPANQRSARRKY